MMSKRTTKQGTAMAIAIMTLMGCDLAPAGDPEPERDIKYDTKHERNVLDFWPAPASDDPAPVYFWFHGGGFQNGDKSQLRRTGERRSKPHDAMSFRSRTGAPSRMPWPMSSKRF